MIDIATRYFFGPGPSMLTKKKPEKKVKENKYENPLKDVDIDTSLDEDDDFADNKKQNKKNKTKEEKENEEEKEKEKKDKKNKKKKNKNKEEDDEDEEENKQVLTIIYDKKSFGKYYENLKNEIMGNFTNFDVEEKEYPLPANKKFFSKITFFTQMGISLLIFSGQKLKEKEKEKIITEINPELEEKPNAVKYDVSVKNENDIISRIFNDEKDIFILEDETIKDKNNVRNIFTRYIFSNIEPMQKIFNAKIKQNRTFETQVKKNYNLVSKVNDTVRSNQSICFWCLQRFRENLNRLRKDDISISIGLEHNDD